MPNLARLASSRDPSASALVELLRAALEPKSKARETLAQRLVPALRRRGVVSALTPEVTEVLLEVVTEAGSKHGQALETLYAIAIGLDPEAALAHRIDASRLDEPVADGLTLRQLREPIVARSKDLLAQLSDADALVRGAAALLASALPEQADTAVPLLEEARAREPDPVAQLVMLFALACHGVRADVPEPPSKNALAVVLSRIVRVLHGGPIDLEAQALAMKLPMSTPPILGTPSASAAVVYANVGEIFRRGDPSALVPIASDWTAVAAMAALWPARRMPHEPRSALNDTERRWLLPLVETGKVACGSASLSQAGIVRGVHLRRLLGLESGPADSHVDGTPLWLFARRVVDRRAPIESWTRALDGNTHDVLAIVRDLENLRVHEPWPDFGQPHAVPSTYQTHARYFGLVRSAFEQLDDASLAKLCDGPVHPLQATALAITVARAKGALPESRDGRLGELLSLEQGANDVEALRALVETLPSERRAAVLRGVRPMATGSLDDGQVLLSQLWFYADLAPPEILAVLIQDLVAIQSLNSTPSKAKTPADAAMAEASRTAVHTVFRSIGAKAVSQLRDALASQKPKSPAHVLLEIALAGAEGRDQPDPATLDPKPAKTKKK